MLGKECYVRNVTIWGNVGCVGMRGYVWAANDAATFVGSFLLRVVNMLTLFRVMQITESDRIWPSIDYRLAPQKKNKWVLLTNSEPFPTPTTTSKLTLMVYSFKAFIYGVEKFTLSMVKTIYYFRVFDISKLHYLITIFHDYTSSPKICHYLHKFWQVRKNEIRITVCYGNLNIH